MQINCIDLFMDIYSTFYTAITTYAYWVCMYHSVLAFDEWKELFLFSPGIKPSIWYGICVGYSGLSRISTDWQANRELYSVSKHSVDMCVQQIDIYFRVQQINRFKSCSLCGYYINKCRLNKEYNTEIATVFVVQYKTQSPNEF